MNIIGIAEIEARYQPGEGRHWFDRDTQRFFRCRLAECGYEAADGSVYFVSSEQNHGMGGPYKRLYTVRVLRGSGKIDTVGEFQQFATASTAARYAKGYSSGNIALPVKE